MKPKIKAKPPTKPRASRLRAPDVDWEKILNSKPRHMPTTGVQGCAVGPNPHYVPPTYSGVFVGGSMDGKRLSGPAIKVTISGSGDALRPESYSFHSLRGEWGLWVIDGITAADAMARVVDAYSRAAGRMSLTNG